MAMVESYPPPPIIRVVIVDDHRMFVQAITDLLAKEDDIDVVGSAGTVAEAGSLVATVQPDVAIVDWRLPDGDGAPVIRDVLAAVPGVRVVVLSGLADERALVAAIEAGCSGFITKDKAADELLAAVRLVYNGEHYIQTELLGHLLPRVRRSYRRVGDDLTAREREVLQLMADGLSNRAIASELNLSNHTVRNHVQNVLTKTGAHTKLEAVAVARREGILDPDA